MLPWQLGVDVCGEPGGAHRAPGGASKHGGGGASEAAPAAGQHTPHATRRGCCPWAPSASHHSACPRRGPAARCAASGSTLPTPPAIAARTAPHHPALHPTCVHTCRAQELCGVHPPCLFELAVRWRRRRRRLRACCSARRSCRCIPCVCCVRRGCHGCAQAVPLQQRVALRRVVCSLVGLGRPDLHQTLSSSTDDQSLVDATSRRACSFLLGSSLVQAPRPCPLGRPSLTCSEAAPSTTKLPRTRTSPLIVNTLPDSCSTSDRPCSPSRKNGARQSGGPDHASIA